MIENGIVGGFDDDDDIYLFGDIEALGNHGSNLTLDAVSLHGSSVAFANGNSDSSFLGLVRPPMNDVMGGFRDRGRRDYFVELLVFENPILTLHLWCGQNELVGDLRAAFGATGRQNLATVVVRHTSAESGHIGMFDF